MKSLLNCLTKETTQEQPTAVEWLFKNIWTNPPEILLEILDKAKEMEKQHIIDAYESGIEEGRMRESSEEYNLERYENAERYYNNKFKNK